MKVAVAQMNSILCDVQGNLSKVQALMKSASGLGADIVLVPETFTTGYNVGERIDEVSDTIPGRTTDAVAKLCRELRIHFYGSFIEKDGGRYHNTAVLLSPKGKSWPAIERCTSFLRRRRCSSRGARYKVVKTEMGTMGLTICMDLSVSRIHPGARAFGRRVHPELHRLAALRTHRRLAVALPAASRAGEHPCAGKHGLPCHGMPVGNRG